jgi:hypothetical protein
MVSMHGHFSFPLTCANVKTRYHFVERNVNLDFSSSPCIGVLLFVWIEYELEGQYICFFTKKKNKNGETKEVVTCFPCLNKLACCWCGMQAW